MTFQQEITQGIPDILPPIKKKESSINHTPKRKEILSQNEKKLAISNALRYFDEKHHPILGWRRGGNHKIKKLAHSFWNISVYNLLGRNNPHSVFFVNEEGVIKAYKTSIFAIPIPTITYNFKF